MSGNGSGKSESALRTIIISVFVALIVGSSAPWWWGKLFPTPPEDHPPRATQSPTSNPFSTVNGSSLPTRSPEQKTETKANNNSFQSPTGFRMKNEGTSVGSTWSRIDSTTWTETLPDGTVVGFRYVERATVDNVQGIIVRRSFDDLDFFIPDINSGSTLLKFRVKGDVQWNPAREMIEIKDGK
jgi:hypothetical protein